MLWRSPKSQARSKRKFARRDLEIVRFPRIGICLLLLLGGIAAGSVALRAANGNLADTAAGATPSLSQTTAAEQSAPAQGEPAQAQSSNPWWYVEPPIPPAPAGATGVAVQTTEQIKATVVNKGGTTATISGTVTDPTGAVLADATVTVSNSSGVKLTATSDAKGVFTVTGLAPGT